MSESLNNSPDFSVGDDRHSIVMVLGPSGAGKSTLGKLLEDDANLLHFEIDQFPNGDGIDAAGLRAEWNVFHPNGLARPLADAIRFRVTDARRSGAVLTFSSLLVLGPQQLNTLTREGITTVILYGAASECLDSFVQHEEQRPRLRGVDPVVHWIQNNRDSYMAFSRPEYASVRLAAFENGRHRARAALVAEVHRRLAG